MPDSETPSDRTERSRASGFSPGATLNGFAQRAKDLARGRSAPWIAVAALCVTAGTIASLSGAHAVARADAAKARLAFRLSSAEIASTLNLAIQREEDLGTSARAFFATNPKASPAELNGWANFLRPLATYPELEKLGLVAIIRAPELAPLKTRIGGFRVVPAGNRPYYCLAVAELAKYPSAGLDYCALTPGLLLSRDSGQSSFLPASARQNRALSIELPVYSGGALPPAVAARKQAFVGWVREVVIPEVLLTEALRGHAGSAVRVRHQSGSSKVEPSAGTPRSGAQKRTVNLGNGWTVESFGAAVGAGVLADRQALAHLLIGILISALLGLLVLVLCTGRVRARPVALAATERRPEELYDSLTGLPNRALMLDRAALMLARAGRHSAMLAGALFIDIDGFKDVNDKLGKAAGDQLLTTVAERLAGLVRAQDTVGRLGGDEFVVLVESATRGIQLDGLARRAIAALHQPIELDEFGPSFALTVSIGVAFGRYATPEDLLHDAQLALYSAKAAGKDRYTLFNASMRSVVEGRGLLETELNAALAERQLFALYEPIYDLNTQEVVGFEALVRWWHPTQGVLRPADFISLAEDTGLIVPVGRWLLEEACTQGAAWNVAGHRVGISVRVSDRQLNRAGFITDVRRALQQSGMEPAMLTLEIAESTIMGDLPAVAARLQEIKQLGVRAAISGFGGDGYARHSELQPVPLDCLSVNMSSIAASDDEKYRSWLLEAILALAQEMSLAVLAKEVETHEQMVALQAMGYTVAQGPVMGEPATADGVVGVFEAKLPKRARVASKSLSR